MLLFHKKDLLVVLTKDGDTVAFSKPIKEILKYQHYYNYKFKLYETGKVTVADDYIIEGETLTVFFGSAYVEYSSSGATYNDGGGSGGGDSVLKVKVSKSGTTYVLDKTGTEVKNAFESGTPVYFYTEGELFLPYDSNPPHVDEGNIKGAFLSDIENIEGRYFFIVYGAYFNENNVLGDSLTFTTSDLSNNPTAGGAL